MPTPSVPALSDLRTLGRSGLPVSPLTLGTMTMGNTGWGSGDEESAAVFHAYVDAGGNSIDTADVYSGGRSEELLGGFIAERGLRDQLVVATKYGFSTQQGNALGGGNGRAHLTGAVEGSLRRLQTDVIDLYWMHVWDGVTPVEEVVQSLGELVRAGKIRYYGFSDMPAWFTARAATLAQAHGAPAPIAVQLEYSLVERSIEREHLPAAHELGLGVVPWSPLGGGLLSGKYTRETRPEQGRLSGSNPFGESKFTDHNFDVLDVVREVAAGMDRHVSQVALAWLTQRPGVATVLLGTRTVDQLTGNLASLEVQLTPEDVARLDAVSAIDPGFPYAIWAGGIAKDAVFGGVTVRGWAE